MADKNFSMEELFKQLGLPVTHIDTYTPQDRREESQSRAMTIPAEALPLIAELGAMVENDPARGTEDEGSFLDAKTRPRTREIGAELYAIGGHVLMLRAHHEIHLKYAPSQRMLEAAWNGVGRWRD